MVIQVQNANELLELNYSNRYVNIILYLRIILEEKFTSYCLVNKELFSEYNMLIIAMFVNRFKKYISSCLKQR